MRPCKAQNRLGGSLALSTGSLRVGPTTLNSRPRPWGEPPSEERAWEDECLLSMEERAWEDECLLSMVLSTKTGRLLKQRQQRCAGCANHLGFSLI